MVLLHTCITYIQGPYRSHEFLQKQVRRFRRLNLNSRKLYLTGRISQIWFRQNCQRQSKTYVTFRVSEIVCKRYSCFTEYHIFRIYLAPTADPICRRRASHAPGTWSSFHLDQSNWSRTRCGWVYVYHLTPMAENRPVGVDRYTTTTTRTWIRSEASTKPHISICTHSNL